MYKQSFYSVNAITLYRLIAAPALLLLIFIKQFEVFKWLLAVSFLTDVLDGYLARKFKVTSPFGSIIDSVSDDLTVAVAITGIVVINPAFLSEQIAIIACIVALFLIQIVAALLRYRKISSFHTYMAKAAAVFQAVFLTSFYFLPKPPYTLFYITAALTIIDLAEEIMLVAILPQWTTDIKGVYWIFKKGAQ
ncbi:CDP-alcohol phosphatidyltransferase family protein [Mucilaginibacter xinganensis]|uniref:CDP-alcohol phosphatidyltransferase n=1 Tax=Mucilaginibacter xinganensis TaxID=1234841 RepID=A0A223NR47_9SPHI|nr:CDP-alcohol phosphatidyltransferase family protein [Mucilaginibacter xinganensis]ASU32389.1 CDP-alcohol phosphatidyltransferase [Mucilaginibacter xinganensis]